MKPVYVDLHIHTSEKADTPNLNYAYDTLIEKVKENACGNEFLISLTDHNMINLKAYLDVKRLTPNVILGTELHIKKCNNSPAYHCHIYFKDEINAENITKINKVLDVLYPVKLVNDETSEIPSIDRIISAFDEFDFLLLPHGGQSVRTFDKAIPRDGKARFDDTLERSLYYNQIDGFTARSDKGTKKTLDYFRKLGISSFVNLVTGTDNYTPQNYPGTKVKDAGEFIPTWMYSTPTFQGLRLSLSESSRFVYQKNKPNEWFGCIDKVALVNQRVDIDVTLTPGLNVVIGGSSSGKTLFVDSLYRSIKKAFYQSEYIEFGVNALTVHNPTQVEPYYIPQNYIVNVLSDKDKDISAIELIQKIFPGDQEESELIRSSLAELKKDLAFFIDKTKKIEALQKDLRKIPTIALIVAREKGRQNFLKFIEGKKSDREKFTLPKSKFDELNIALDSISRVLQKNPIIDDCEKEIEIVRTALNHAYSISELEKIISSQISISKQKIDALLQEENAEIQRKQKNREELLNLLTEYIEEYSAFCVTKSKLSEFNIKYETKQIEVSGYKLSIENMFSLKEATILDEFNKILKKNAKIEEFEDISPDKLFITEFLQAQCKTYEDVTNKIYAEFEKKNKKFYRISTKEGKDFDHFSAGWKCAILLDIILKYKDDNAPIIIDQPEDNLANTYINEGLIKAIKEAKPNKQIILVSHNATIPMLGDAQNVILCRNENGLIKIRSGPLEGEIDNTSVVDWVADITDGGKASIKKRVKKYNLKSFKE